MSVGRCNQKHQLRDIGLSICAVLEVLRRIPLRHRGVAELCSEPSNFEHRAIIRKVHHLELGYRVAAGNCGAQLGIG